ncbi:MAG TPA: hypothetical protein VL381_01645 [Rhodocyclaceae bacterium]|jgi:hypothetical protein|nr:hypothetical protein [Rhodocyclaceae bacterium]
MKSYHVLMGITALVLATSSGVVISKSHHPHDAIKPQTQVTSSAQLPIADDMLGDVGDELVASCNGHEQSVTCPQQWSELSRIASTAPNGLR